MEIAFVHKKVEFDQFLEVYQDLLTKYPKFIGIFKGSVDPATGQNWCPDCVAAEEPIKKYLFPLAQEKNIPIIEVNVGSRPEWKDPNHYLRTDKKLKIARVPTVGLITSAGMQKRLEEDLCLDQELLCELLD